MKHIEAKATVTAVDGVRPLTGAPEGWTANAPGEQPPAVPLPLATLLKTALYNVPCETIHDSEMGRKLIQQIGSANGTIDLEDADYAWLVSKLETHLPKIFGVQAIQIFEAVKEGGHVESRGERRRNGKKP